MIKNEEIKKKIRIFWQIFVGKTFRNFLAFFPVIFETGVIGCVAVPAWFDSILCIVSNLFLVYIIL